MVRDSNLGHQLLLPPANWCPIFSSQTTHTEAVLSAVRPLWHHAHTVCCVPQGKEGIEASHLSAGHSSRLPSAAAMSQASRMQSTGPSPCYTWQTSPSPHSGTVRARRQLQLV